MSKRRVTWLIVGPEPHLATCERCGGHVDKPPMPLSIPAFVAYVKYAEELHRQCEEVK